MTGLVIFFHVVVCVLMATVILMQSGRGGGLTEAFASAESMFGANTSAFLIKFTTILSVIFFVTCLGLAVLSSKKGKSLMAGKVAAPRATTPLDFSETLPVTNDAATTQPTTTETAPAATP